MSKYGIALCEPHNLDFLANLELLTYQLSAAIKIIALLKQQESMLEDLHTKNLTLENVSKIDELTEIYNRRGFFVAASKIVCTPENKGKDLIVAYADMDNLKMVNDGFGHIEGDFSIKSIALCLKDIFNGNSSVVGRVGGDEFAVISVKDEVGTKEDILQRKGKRFEVLNAEADKPYHISMSMGLYECHCENIYDIKDAMDKADDLLYKEKKLRKKQI